MQIIAGFPGVGKSYLFDRAQRLRVLDSDSSKFSKDDFPHNYIDHIKSVDGVDVLLISSHKAVRDALRAEQIRYTLVYPHKSLKNEYIERYRMRGSSEDFIKLIANNWDAWIDELEKEVWPDNVVLGKDEHLTDLWEEWEL